MQFKHETIHNKLNTCKKFKCAKSASDDCQVGEFGEWGECTGAVCGGNGKQYRQRYYKSPEKATKCHRKLFETKTCIMPRCAFGIEDLYPHNHFNILLESFCSNAPLSISLVPFPHG